MVPFFESISSHLQPIPRYPIGARLLVLHHNATSVAQPPFGADDEGDYDEADSPDGWWMSSLRPNRSSRTDTSSPSRTRAAVVDNDHASASHIDIGWLGEADAFDVTLQPCRVLAIIEHDGVCSYVVRLLSPGSSAGTGSGGGDLIDRTVTVEEWRLMRDESPL